MKKNKYLTLNLFFLTNFNLISFMKLKNFKKNKKLIILKNFLLFIFFLNFFRQNFLILKINYYIKPVFNNIYNVLRAPYRYKLSKSQISFSRNILFICMLFNNNFNYFIFTDIKQLIYFLKFLKTFFFLFEINLFFQKKINVSFSFFFEKFWIIK